MPNWCVNRLRIEGEPEDVEQFVKAANGPTQVYGKQGGEKKTSVLSFHQIVPIPDEVLLMRYDPFGSTAEFLLWGVKWGTRDAEIVDQWEGGSEYDFLTPWEPPEAFLVRASARFPCLEFFLKYGEESLFDLIGSIRLSEGQVIGRSYMTPIEVDGKEGQSKLTKECLEHNLPLVAYRLDRLGGTDKAKEFVKSLDPSLALAV